MLSTWKTNIRTVTPEQLGELVDFISIDVAFISLDKVLPVATTLLKDTGSLVALIKPQFEAGKENVGKGGIDEIVIFTKKFYTEYYKLLMTVDCISMV